MTLTFWPWIVFPAILTALIVNLDARYSGPYFSLTSLIWSTEGLEAHLFMSKSSLRNALIRRFLFPLVLGFALAWHIQSWYDVGAAGALAAGLLVWPAVFHPIPSEVSRRRDIVFLYLAFIGSYFGFSICGFYIKFLMVHLSNGDVRVWIENQFLSMLFGAVFVVLCSSFYRVTFRNILKRERE